MRMLLLMLEEAGDKVLMLLLLLSPPEVFLGDVALQVPVVEGRHHGKVPAKEDAARVRAVRVC